MALKPAARVEPAAILGMRLGRVMVLGFGIALIWGTARGLPHHDAARAAAAWAATAVYIALFTAAMVWPSVGLILATSLLTIAMQVLNANGPAYLAAIGAAALAGSRLAPVPGRVVAALLCGGLIGAVAIGAHRLALGDVLAPLSSVLFTYLAGASIGELRREQRRTAALLQEVLAGRDAQVRAAALEERSRLAREMHDILAHTLSALSIQLEGARLLAEQRSCDPDLTRTLERASHLAREGLLEARRAVSSLRDDALMPGPHALPALSKAFEHDTGIPTILRVEGQARDLQPEARLAIYRTAQEALTNVRKHSEAEAVIVTLCYTAGEVWLHITDRGRPRQESPPEGSGYGLVGMRERAELLGGHLEAGPVADGFRVALRIPQ